MLRSKIARVIFIIAISIPSLTSLQSAQAEMPFDAWMTVAIDSVDHQINRQYQRPWATIEYLRRRTQQNLDRVLNQCRMGVGGTRGLQLVRGIELLEELRNVGVAGILSPAKNWNFPLENHELHRNRIVQGDELSLYDPVLQTAVHGTGGTLSTVLTQCCSGQRLFQTALDQITTEANKQMASLREEVFRPTQPLVQTVIQPWEKWNVASADQKRVELVLALREPSAEQSFSGILAPFKLASLERYWLDVSNFAQAKLNWLTSKARHIAEACLKSIEPQFLALEHKPLA